MGFLRASMASTGIRLTHPPAAFLGACWGRSETSARSPAGSAFAADEAHGRLNTGTDPLYRAVRRGRGSQQSSRPDSQGRVGGSAPARPFLLARSHDT